jgi:hypothetical protein
VLTVEVDSAPLAAELESFGRDHLLGALEHEGLVGLCRVRFRTGRAEGATRSPSDPGPGGRTST